MTSPGLNFTFWWPRKERTRKTREEKEEAGELEVTRSLSSKVIDALSALPYLKTNDDESTKCHQICRLWLRDSLTSPVEENHARLAVRTRDFWESVWKLQPALFFISVTGWKLSELIENCFTFKIFINFKKKKISIVRNTEKILKKKMKKLCREKIFFLIKNCRDCSKSTNSIWQPVPISKIY